jgi:hypothetical protein
MINFYIEYNGDVYELQPSFSVVNVIGLFGYPTENRIFHLGKGFGRARITPQHRFKMPVLSFF